MAPRGLTLSPRLSLYYRALNIANRTERLCLNVPLSDTLHNTELILSLNCNGVGIRKRPVSSTELLLLKDSPNHNFFNDCSRIACLTEAPYLTVGPGRTGVVMSYFSCLLLGPPFRSGQGVQLNGKVYF